MLPLVLPAVAGITGWAFLLSPRVGYVNLLLRQTPFFDHLDTGPLNVYSMSWIIILTGLNLAALVYIFVLSALTEIPSDMKAAAAICGASPFQVARRVTLPLIRPAIVYGGGTAFLLALGQITAPLLLGPPENIHVITTQLFRVREHFPPDYALMGAWASPLVIAGLALILVQRWILRGRSRYAASGRKENVDGEGTAKAAIPPLAFGALALLLPLMALFHVALSPFWTGELSISNLSLNSFQAVLFENQRTIDAIKVSLLASGIATGLTVLLGFASALAVWGWKSAGKWSGRLVDLLVSLPLAMPAVIFGIGVLFVYTRPPLQIYGTSLVIVVVYVTLMIPHVTRIQTTGLFSLNPEIVDAAGVFGASPGAILVRVVLPLSRGAVVSAAALAFVLLSHEFAASLMVRSARTQVMGTVLYDLWTSGIYPEVAAMALIMVLVTAVGLVVALSLGGSRVVATYE
jgi:iron(III) transport system permease protein